MCRHSTIPPDPARARNVLHEGEVLLWWMAVQSPPADTVARWYATLDEGERTRADRFRFAADRETYIAAHALTRALLQHIDALPASAWRFITGPTGKPQIAPTLGRPNLRFSLSHTRGLVACAAGLAYELGVDVEADDGSKNQLEPAASFFAPDELSLLGSMAEEQRRKAFFRIWTLKEAYIKAIGLPCPLDSFAFDLDPITIRVDGAPNDAANWQFFQFAATPNHVISLAARHAPTSLRLIQRAINVDEL